MICFYNPNPEKLNKKMSRLRKKWYTYKNHLQFFFPFGGYIASFITEVCYLQTLLLLSHDVYLG